MTIASDGDTSRPSRTAFLAALKGAKREARRHIKALDRIATSNAAFDRWIDRASADLALLITELETGPYPYAGIPWFSVPFGRDALVTALQVLWINPALARGVLAYLSAAQAAERSSFHDAEPGKILHETRKGEMARLRGTFGRWRRRRCDSAVRHVGRRIPEADERRGILCRAMARDPRGAELDRGFWRCRRRRLR
jgi:glycogen debranching enzyme